MRVPNTNARKPKSAPVPADMVTSPAVAPRAGFMRDNRGTIFGGWRPALRSSRDDVALAWNDAAARSVELWQNSGWISGMIDQAAANTVGTGLRLQAMPENDLFGMSEAEAQVWRKLVEARFSLYADDPRAVDIEGRQSLALMTETAFKAWVPFGDIFGEIVLRSRGGHPSRTKVRLLMPSRISNRTDPTARIFSGVRVDADGMPISYLGRRENPFLGDQEVEVKALDRYGRPGVFHQFLGMPGQTRGIGIITPVLRAAKQFDQLADATLMAAVIQTIFAASIESDMPDEDAYAALMTHQDQAQLARSGMSQSDVFFAAREGWAEGHPIDLGIAGRIAHMFPGEKLNFNSPEIPTVAYKEFSLHLLREIARCLGLTYESATGDYERATYSSVRAAVNEVYPITLARRKHLLSPFLQAIYSAWLEEEIETGRIPFPGGIMNFIANRQAATRARWRGDPKPQADDLKAAKAHELYRNMGVISDSDVAADLGLDIEDVYAQRAREARLRERYKLPPNVYPQSLVADAQAKARQAEEPDDEPEEEVEDEDNPNIGE